MAIEKLILEGDLDRAFFPVQSGKRPGLSNVTDANMRLKNALGLPADSEDLIQFINAGDF